MKHPSAMKYPNMTIDGAARLKAAARNPDKNHSISTALGHIAEALYKIEPLRDVAFAPSGDPRFYARVPRLGDEHRFFEVQIVGGTKSDDETYVVLLVQALLDDMGFEVAVHADRQPDNFPVIRNPKPSTNAWANIIPDLSAHERMTILSDMQPHVTRALLLYPLPSHLDQA